VYFSRITELILRVRGVCLFPRQTLTGLVPALPWSFLASPLFLQLSPSCIPPSPGASARLSPGPATRVSYPKTCFYRRLELLLPSPPGSPDYKQARMTSLFSSSRIPPLIFSLWVLTSQVSFSRQAPFPVSRGSARRLEPWAFILFVSSDKLN